MIALKAQFDGEKIVLPDALRGLPPQEVIVVCVADFAEAESQAWHKAQEATFAKAWNNAEDAAYDNL